MSEPIASHQVKDDVKKAYDEIAGFYLDWTQPSHETRLSYLKIVLRSFNTANDAIQKSVLELGCGAGVPCTQLLASHQHVNVTANDISDTQIALARQRLPQSVNLIPGDMMELEFGPEQFDAVLAMYSIIHLPRDEQTVILRRVFTWLNPGGQLLANSLSPNLRFNLINRGWEPQRGQCIGAAGGEVKHGEFFWRLGSKWKLMTWLWILKKATEFCTTYHLTGS